MSTWSTRNIDREYAKCKHTYTYTHRVIATYTMKRASNNPNALHTCTGFKLVVMVTYQVKIASSMFPLDKHIALIHHWWSAPCHAMGLMIVRVHLICLLCVADNSNAFYVCSTKLSTIILSLVAFLKYEHNEVRCRF